MKLLLHLSIFFFVLSISLQSSHSCTYYEKKALLQIKKSLNNPLLLSSWNYKTDCCSGWTGVQCTNSRVTGLDISDGEVYGQIPTQIGDLPYLKSLHIQNLPHLTGNIPRTITKLKNLDHLFIWKTNLSGPIPAYIGQLKTLTFLLLSSNQLTGPIPAYIGQLKTLTLLDLSSNQLTGPIPGWLSQLPKISYIHLSDNKLTGPLPNSMDSFLNNSASLSLSNNILSLSNNKLSGKIPKSWSKYDFNTLDLSGNRFEGDGSMFFGQWKTTAKVDLSKNEFQFDLSKVKFAKTIFSVVLSHNRIFGKLPRKLTNPDLIDFNVSYNLLCGKIPQGGNLQVFNPSVYSHNKCLCGAPLKPC